MLPAFGQADADNDYVIIIKYNIQTKLFEMK